MEKIRKRIDKVDQQIMTLISERLRLMDYVRNIQNKQNMPLIDKKRKKQVFDSRVELAKELNIKKKFAKKLMKTILSGCENHLLQKESLLKRIKRLKR